MNNTNNTPAKKRIRAATRRIFHQRGYAATRTRDIVEEAGINHVTLNYYSRSKEKLFRIVMIETMTQSFRSIGVILNDGTTSLDEKIERVVANHIDLLLEESDLPAFILNEVRPSPQFFVEQGPIGEALAHSVLACQYAEAVVRGRITESNLMHATLNIIGLAIFPSVAKPMLNAITNLPKEQHKALMLRRKTFIPQRIKAVLSLPEAGG